jgi:hypothetical protein
MQLTKEQKEEIVIQLASWLPPKEIEKEYGISQASIYYYCNKYQIPKYRENMSIQKKDYTQHWLGFLQDITTLQIDKVKELLNDNK